MNTITTHESVTALAAAGGAPTADGISKWILGILGTLVIVFIAGRAFGHFAKREYGELIGSVAAGLVVGAFCWFPDQTTSALKALINMVFG